MYPKISIAVLITCYNRIHKTLQCLTALYAQLGIADTYSIEVFLVDDASTDGTGEAVKNQFPSVHIIKGNGNLYWNRGMHLAWQNAAAAKDFDYYLWLNDDTFLYKNAIQTLLQNKFPKAIVCGTTQSQSNQKATYGGYNKKPHQLILPNCTYQNSDYCNGNCVLIPKLVYQKLGNLDTLFHHALGDFDYSLRARKMGIEVFVAPNFIGICEAHVWEPKWQNNAISWKCRLQDLYTPSSGCSPPEFFKFDKRHHGIILACFHYFTIHLRAIIPSLWRK